MFQKANACAIATCYPTNLKERKNTDRFEEVPLEQIEWPDPIRKEINEKDVDKMAKSFLASNQIQPIVIEEKAPSKYHGVVGRLRYEGAHRAHKTTILARIHNFTDDSDRKSWQLIENLVRRELNAIQKAEGYKSFQNYCEKELEGKFEKPIVSTIKKKIQEASGEQGPAEKTIYKYLQIAEDLPENIKKIVGVLPEENFGVKHAEQLLRLKNNPDEMLEIATFIGNNKPSVAQLKTYIDDLLKVKAQALQPIKEALKKEEISLKSAAAISEASGDLQGSLLTMAKHPGLTDTDIKKVVHFTKTHEDRAEEILSKPPIEAIAIAEGKDTLKTDEETEIFFEGKKETESMSISAKCPKCQTIFQKNITINWKKGEITWTEDE